VIVKAYECLLLCTGLKDPAIAKTIGEHTKLAPQLVCVHVCICVRVCVCVLHCAHACVCVCVRVYFAHVYCMYACNIVYKEITCCTP